MLQKPLSPDPAAATAPALEPASPANTVSTRASQEFSRASVRSLSRKPGSFPFSRARRSAAENSAASRAISTSGNASHSGMGVVTTGLPPAKYSKSLRGEVERVIGLIRKGMVATSKDAK